MRTTLGWAFVSLALATPSTFAENFSNGGAKVMASPSTDIVTTTTLVKNVPGISVTAPPPVPATAAEAPAVAPPAPAAPAAPEVRQQAVQATAPAQVGPRIPQIEVDLATQTAWIWYVGMARPIKVPVSTGGTLKKPDGKDRLQDGELDPMQIYCGHWESRRVNAKGLVANPYPEGSDEDPRDEKWTTFRKYYSGAFGLKGQSGGIPMPFAIRVPTHIQEANRGQIVDRSTDPISIYDCEKSPHNRRCAPRGGIFIHEAPATQEARENMGKAVSGGCVRLPPVQTVNGEEIRVAKKLWEQTNEFKGINITIKNDPPAYADRTCNQQIVNDARAEVMETRRQRDEDFGSSIANAWKKFWGIEDEQAHRPLRRAQRQSGLR